MTEKQFSCPEDYKEQAISHKHEDTITEVSDSDAVATSFKTTESIDSL